MKRIRVATYNVHRCRGIDGRTRPDRVAAVLREIDADLIGLQEVVSIEGLRPEADQAAYLAEATGGTYAMGETRRHGTGAYGNVTICRLPIEGWRHLDVSVIGRERRGVLRTDLRVGHRTIHAFNLHLGTSWRERRRQAARLIDSDLLKAIDIEGPRIVLGDLNEWTRGLVTRTLAAELRCAEITLTPQRRRAYPGVLPLLQLDYVYYDDELTLESAYYHRTRRSLVASDHLPLVAEFKLGK